MTVSWTYNSGRVGIATVWAESVLYGANCILFLACIYILVLRGDGRTRWFWFLLGTTGLSFGVSTAHVIISLIQLLEQLGRSLNADQYWSAIWLPPAAIKMYLYISNVFLQDLLVIWRLFVVWDHNWKICIIPLLIEAIHTAVDLVAIYLCSEPSVNISSPHVQGWVITGWATNVLLNIGLIGMITWRLWSTDRQISSVLPPTSTYKTVMMTIIESGAIYTSAELVTFAINLYGNIGGYIGNAVVTQVATLSPFLILVRVGLGMTHGHSSGSGSTDAPPTSPNILIFPPGLRTQHRRSESRYCDFEDDIPLSTMSQESEAQGRKTLELVERGERR